jgi:3-vinyl bacteriochlorophyllide hydratase
MAGTAVLGAPRARRALYTPDQQARRDASPWTVVQGVLAPLQLLVCLGSIALVGRYLATGDGWVLAAGSVALKTALLYLIMVTGSIWEREVFGVWLFAEPFFWEDAVSFVVIGLHTAYLLGWLVLGWSTTHLATLALVAYAVYLVNAAQFLHKLRLARRDRPQGMEPAA